MAQVSILTTELPPLAVQRLMDLADVYSRSLRKLTPDDDINKILNERMTFVLEQLLHGYGSAAVNEKEVALSRIIFESQEDYTAWLLTL